MIRVFDERFAVALRNVYQRDPCGVLPNALWKTLVQAKSPGVECWLDEDVDGISQLVLKARDAVPCWWHRDVDVALPFPAAQVLLLHERDLELVTEDAFPQREGYFRLSHLLHDVDVPELPDGYRFAVVDYDVECALVSDVIGQCYEDLHPDEETVRGWTTHPVFDADLWLWVLDADGSPAALGVAELDREIGEGSLEWIQVLPSEQREGLGRVLVLELLRRIAVRAGFVTVSGRVDGVGVERFYRSCGFTGDDVWWVVRR